MKHIKIYENLNNEPKVDDYILYNTDKRSYYILKIISINSNNILLKPLYEIYKEKFTRDIRDIITWSYKAGGMETLLNSVVYFSDNLKNVVKHFKLINDVNKYNL